MSAFFPFELEPPPWLYRRMVRLGIMQRLYRRLGADLMAAAPTGGLLLDVGAGPGQLLTLVARQRPDLRLLAVDREPAMLGPLPRQLHKHAMSAHPWRLAGDAAALPVASASCDMALATFSFHTWERPVAGLREMRRVVKPGGAIWLYEMNREASLGQLRSLAQEEVLPFFLVAVGFRLLSWNHALRAADFSLSLSQAGITNWELQPAHQILWRAVF